MSYLLATRSKSYVFTCFLILPVSVTLFSVESSCFITPFRVTPMSVIISRFPPAPLRIVATVAAMVTLPPRITVVTFDVTPVDVGALVLLLPPCRLRRR